MIDAGAPLAGIRIVAVEQFGAGPFATLYLADMGADVIKVEDPAMGGDVGRYIPPVQEGSDSLYFESFNRGKRSLVLDLKDPSGRIVFEALVRSADVVFNNLRGDVPAQLGLTYAALERVNPAIVCASLSAYGKDGRRAKLPGYDALIQAEAGWAALTGEPDGPPTKSGLSLADYVGGLLAALAITIALLDARRTGRGRDVDVNLYDGALAMLSYPATWALSRGISSPRQPLSAHPSVVPFQFFETADGHIALACPKEKFFQALVAAIDLPDLATDPRFSDFDRRSEHRKALLTILAARFTERTTAEWIELLREKVPVAPVRSMDEALDVDELSERGMLAEYEHQLFGTVRGIGTPLALAGYRPRYGPAPGLGESTASILEELGFDESQRQQLATSGAFGKTAMPRHALAATSGARG